MTTIAWDGKTLVADRRINANGIADGEMTKVVKRKKDGALCATAGTAALAAEFQRWFLNGEKGQRPPLKVDDNTASCLIIRPSGALIVHDYLGWHEMHTKYTALGTGWEIALGAMSAGTTAEEAVRIAAKLDGVTGGGLDILEPGK